MRQPEPIMIRMAAALIQWVMRTMPGWTRTFLGSTGSEVMVLLRSGVCGRAWRVPVTARRPVPAYCPWNDPYILEERSIRFFATRQFAENFTFERISWKAIRRRKPNSLQQAWMGDPIRRRRPDGEALNGRERRRGATDGHGRGHG